MLVDDLTRGKHSEKAPISNVITVECVYINQDGYDATSKIFMRSLCAYIIVYEYEEVPSISAIIVHFM